jgi:hypothetical protein
MEGITGTEVLMKDRNDRYIQTQLKAAAFDKLIADIRAGKWKLVPMRPSKEMLDDAYRMDSLSDFALKRAYSSMYEAAPVYEGIEEWLK